MITNELQAIWREWLAESERVLRLLHEQTAGVMLRDVERVERLQPEIEKHIEILREIDSRAVECARTIAEQLGCKPSFKDMVSKLDREEAQAVHAIANKVKAAAQNVQGVVTKNRALIENELAYVAGSLHLLAKTAENQEGAFGTRSHAAVLLDQKV